MKRVTFILLGCSLLLSANGYAEKCKTTCSLSFVVVNCSNQPVKDVPIELTFNCDRPPVKKVTDADGKAAFPETCASDVESKKISQLSTRKFDTGDPTGRNEEVLEMKIRLCNQ